MSMCIALQCRNRSTLAPFSSEFQHYTFIVTHEIKGKGTGSILVTEWLLGGERRLAVVLVREGQ